MTTIFDVPGTNPPNTFTTPIQAVLSSTNASPATGLAAQGTVATIVRTITSSSDPGNALWQLWDVFFTTVVRVPSTDPKSFARHLALLDAIRAHLPTQSPNLTPGSERERSLRISGHIQPDGHFHWSRLPLFAAQWRDTHDILEAWRDWDGIRASTGQSTLTASPAEYYLRFIVFSAVLLQATNGKDTVHPINVFYASRNVLEREGLQAKQDEPGHTQPGEHKMSIEKVWALDVRIMATWVKYGGRVLWEADGEHLKEHFARTLEWKTDLWPNGEGLTRQRWRLWGTRLRSLRYDEEILDEETRKTVSEAAKVVEELIGAKEAT